MLLHKLDHPGIVHFIGINVQSIVQPGLLEPSIITEYYPNGSLRDMLKNRSNSTWNATKKFITLLGIAKAMSYLHKNGKGIKKNIDQAIECYKKAQELGNPEALYHLGRVYENGEFFKQSDIDALEFYQKSSSILKSYIMKYENKWNGKKNLLKTAKFYQETSDK